MDRAMAASSEAAGASGAHGVGATAVTSAAAEGVPEKVTLVAGSVAKGGIYNEYVFSYMYNGRAVYKVAGTSYAMYYASTGRWVIDPCGVSDSEIYVAVAHDTHVVAADTPSRKHPCFPDLVWQLFDAAAHVWQEDRRVAVLDAPSLCSVAGGSPCVGGEYELVGMHLGRPSYQQKGGNATLMYHEHKRWMLYTGSGDGDSHAFCEAQESFHPGAPGLTWHTWDAEGKAFRASAHFGVVADAPLRVHLLAGPASLDAVASSPLRGTYVLAGAYAGYPYYWRPGTQTVLRHAIRDDRWLIDMDALAEPSLLSKFQRLLGGEAGGDSDRCNAFADACGSKHPGHPGLEWQTVDSRSTRFVHDPWVRSTTAPLLVKVRGESSLDDYSAIGSFDGRIVYQKVGANRFLRYHSLSQRWLLTASLSDSPDCPCSAYAERARETPLGAGPWHMRDPARGTFYQSQHLAVVAHPEAPKALPEGEDAAAWEPPRKRAARGVLRLAGGVGLVSRLFGRGGA